MKLKQIAIASLVAVAGSSFAQTTLTCDKTTAQNFVNTCAPNKTFFIAGASALGDVVNSVVVNTFFDTTALTGITNGFVEVVDLGSPSGHGVINPTNNGKAGQGVKAWYGMSKVHPGETLFVVYNSYMGSAAGVSNVMSDAKLLNATTVPESLVVTVGPSTTGKGKTAVTTANNCALVTAALPIPGESTKTVSAATNKVACTTTAVTRADIGVSDVDAQELVGFYGSAIKGGATKFPAALALMQRDFLAMQGFGVAVNKNFYGALQAAQGLNTGACAPAPGPTDYIYTEACQPTITRAQYAGVANVEGGIKSAAGFIPGSTEMLTLARRDALSGTQAAAEMYFGAVGCNKLDAKSKINTRGGALTTRDSSANVPGVFAVNPNVQTSNVETDLKLATGFTIGVVTLSRATTSDYRFVKLNGVSPNFLKGGTAPSLTAVRTNMIEGLWDFQVASYAIYPKTAVLPASPKVGLINAMVNAMGDSGKVSGGLPAIAYLRGTATEMHSKVTRHNGNNCSPLVSRNN
jgi:hypothetical protein